MTENDGSILPILNEVLAILISISVLLIPAMIIIL